MTNYMQAIDAVQDRLKIRDEYDAAIGELIAIPEEDPSPDHWSERQRIVAKVCELREKLGLT